MPSKSWLKIFTVILVSGVWDMSQVGVSIRHPLDSSKVVNEAHSGQRPLKTEATENFHGTYMMLITETPR